jgi:hypothetical protein
MDVHLLPLSDQLFATWEPPDEAERGYFRALEKLGGRDTAILRLVVSDAERALAAVAPVWADESDEELRVAIDLAASVGVKVSEEDLERRAREDSFVWHPAALAATRFVLQQLHKQLALDSAEGDPVSYLSKYEIVRLTSDHCDAQPAARIRQLSGLSIGELIACLPTVVDTIATSLDFVDGHISAVAGRPLRRWSDPSTSTLAAAVVDPVVVFGRGGFSWSQPDAREAPQARVESLECALIGLPPDKDLIDDVSQRNLSGEWRSRNGGADPAIWSKLMPMPLFVEQGAELRIVDNGDFKGFRSDQREEAMLAGAR